MFDLYNEAVEVLENSNDPDPKKSANALLSRIPEAEFYDILLTLLPTYLSNIANSLRHRSPETVEALVEVEVFANKETVLVPAGLPKAPSNGVAKGFSAQVQQQKVGRRLFINAQTREWKWYEDTTKADWEAVALDRKNRAETSLLRSKNASRAVELFDNANATTYAELNDYARNAINALDV